VSLSDEEVYSLADNMENEIKQIKDNWYRIGWYMRGSANIHDLITDTDVGDIEIFNNIIKDNVETSKNTKMPWI
jgi:hypothetical protein